MDLKELNIQGCYEYTPPRYGDERGYFSETYNPTVWTDAIPGVVMIQDNEAFSSKGILRGLHFQKGQYAQSKLLRCVQGEVQDVAVDLRKDSPTYKNYVSVVLDAASGNQIYIPKGCAHGYLVLSDTAKVVYKCDALYAPHAETGLYYADPEINIPWELSEGLILSEKDQILPRFNKLEQELYG